MLLKYYNYSLVICILWSLVNSNSVNTKNSFQDNIMCQVNCLKFHAKDMRQVNSCQENCKSVLETRDTNFGQNPINSTLSPPTLYCLTEDTITVTWLPWWQHNSSRLLVYFVQWYNKNLTRTVSSTTKNSNITLENLTPQTKYIIRLVAIESFPESSDVTVLGPVFSSWISTLSTNYTPQPVSNISLKSLEFVQGKFQATIEWTPDKEQPACYYELVHFNHAGSGNFQQIEFLQPHRRFEAIIEESEFDSNFSIGIMAKSKDGERESLTSSAYFITPSCLDVVGNINNCAPAQPSNLILEEKLVNINMDASEQITYYDISISWDLPKFLPDNYIVTLYILSLKLNLTVGGNQTKAVFKNIDIGSQYLVSVVAYSNGGSSEPARVQRQITLPRILPPTKHVWMIAIIVFVAIIVFSLFGAAFYIYHRNAKRTRYERRCKYFEELEKKAPKNVEFIRSGTSLINNDSYKETDKWELRPERLVLQRILGEGAFGLVRRGWLWDEKESKSTEVAVKMLKDAPTSEQSRQFMHEIDIMKTVGLHPHLVSLIGCCTNLQLSHGASMMLVVEFCALGDLQNYLRNIWDTMTSVMEPTNPKYADLVSPTSSEGSPNLIINKLYEIETLETNVNLKPSDLLSFARQIVVGMQFLANMKVLHRDLAARNVLVCADKTVKIADFGLSRDVYKENMYKKSGNGRLPIRWLAIESLTHQIYTSQSDVWSFGILLWEIVTLGGNPYPSIPTNTLLKFLRSGYRMERPSNCGQELYSIMLSCWNVRPKDRPTFTELRRTIDDLLLSQTTSKYLDLDILNSTEFASFRGSIKESPSITIKRKPKISDINRSDRYVRPIMVNNAKNSSHTTEVPIIIK